jgi:hypothetical protein
LVLSVLFILSTPLAFVHAYYFGMFLSISILAYLNGIILLPVLLCIIGPVEKRATATIVNHDEHGSADSKHQKGNLQELDCSSARNGEGGGNAGGGSMLGNCHSEEGATLFPAVLASSAASLGEPGGQVGLTVVAADTRMGKGEH